ncbi:CAP domain-containing protein [Aspergillus spectabilis]
MRRLLLTNYIPLLLLASLISLPTTALETTVIVTITATATATTPTTENTSPKVLHDPSYMSSTLFKSSILTTTNTYRTAHNASSLTWNETLASYAKKWAESCDWAHSHGPYGENLAYGYPNATAAVRAWGDEVRMYDFDKPTGFTEETGHFTQLVWVGTREVGCAAVDCGVTDWGTDGEVRRAQGWYVVCEYVPGGNVVGDDNRWFRLNVMEGDEDEDEDDDRDRSDLGWLIRGQGSSGLLAWSFDRVTWWAGMVACILSYV